MNKLRRPILIKEIRELAGTEKVGKTRDYFSVQELLMIKNRLVIVEEKHGNTGTR